MSAKTRQAKSQPDTTAAIADLADLHAQAILLIKKGARTATMIDMLRQALQLFKENRLLATIAGGVQLVRDQKLLFQVLSSSLFDLPLEKSVRRFLLRIGVELVGELYYAELDPRPHAVTTKKLHGILTGTLNLPTKLDPLALGWQPPYWSDNTFYRALNQPIGVLVRAQDEYDLWRFHKRGLHYVGQLLHSGEHLSAAWLRQRRWKIRQDRGIRVGMIRPPGWKRPAEVPQEWIDLQEKRLKKEEALEAERERRHAEEEGARRKLLESDSPIFQRRIDDLELSVRAHNCLMMANIKTVGELVVKTEVEMLKYQNFGRKVLREVCEVLESMGLSLGMTKLPEN